MIKEYQTKRIHKPSYKFLNTKFSMQKISANGEKSMAPINFRLIFIQAENIYYPRYALWMT